MPPSIVITEPVPRWKAWALYTLKVGSLLLLCAASFYAGLRYERHFNAGRVAEPQAPAPAEADHVEAPAAPAPQQQARAEPEPQGDWLAPRSLEGLQIQSLKVVADPAVPGLLRYEFEVLNEGRLYDGSFEFQVRGTQQGQATQWVFPTEAQRGRGIYRLRVARYLKSAGTIQLPPGLAPQAIALSLNEPAGVRASRGQALPAAGPLSPLPGAGS